MERRVAISLIILIFLSILWIFPVYTIIVGSFKSLREVMESPSFTPPKDLDFTTLTKVFSEMRKPLINTFTVVVPVAFLATLVGSMAAYAIYRRFDKLSDTLIVFIAISTYIPYQAMLIPLMTLFRALEDSIGIRLFDTPYGLALGFAAYYTPMAALLMTIFITVIPKDFVEAALVDGASEFRVYRKVVLPLLGPGLVSTFIFILIMTWNNFFIPLVLTRGYEKHVTLKIFSYVGQSGSLYNEMFAAALIGSLPPLLLFIVLGRYFIRGMLVLGTGGVR